jgi:hypothetical protein
MEHENEPHCCACAGCFENPNGCPEGSVEVVKSGLDRQERLYLVGADGSVSLFGRGRGKPDLSEETLQEIAKAVESHKNFNRQFRHKNHGKK